MSLLFLRPSPAPTSLFLRSLVRHNTTQVQIPHKSGKRAKPRLPSSRATGGGPGKVGSVFRLADDAYQPLVTPTSATTTSAASESSDAEKQEAAPVFEKLGYYVGRTPSQQLPIYQEARRGGNLRQTVVKKVQGDIGELARQLQEHLELEDKHITINHLNSSVIIKGRVRQEVAAFLRARHF